MTDKVRILLIDDDPDFVEANSIILDANGFEVLTASSIHEGFRKVKQDKPALIVLDLLMENADEGFTLARRIRCELKSTAPFVMLSSVTQETGYSFRPDEHPDYYPVDHFLEKPVSPGVLLEKIRSSILEGEK